MLYIRKIYSIVEKGLKIASDHALSCNEKYTIEFAAKYITCF